MSYPGEPAYGPVGGPSGIGQATPEQFLRMLEEYRHRQHIVDAADLTEQERQDALDMFVKGRACSHCGGLHPRACPRVKRLAFDGQGRVAEVEFWAWGEWPADVVVWPEDVAESQEVETSMPPDPQK